MNSDYEFCKCGTGCNKVTRHYYNEELEEYICTDCEDEYIQELQEQQDLDDLARCTCGAYQYGIGEVLVVADCVC